MQTVNVVFKGGGTLSFKTGDECELQYSTDEDNYGKLVGYKFEKIGTKTSAVYLDLEEVAGIIVIGDKTYEETSWDNKDEPLITPIV